jgi:hypothetical protein
MSIVGTGIGRGRDLFFDLGETMGKGTHAWCSLFTKCLFSCFWRRKIWSVVNGQLRQLNILEGELLLAAAAVASLPLSSAKATAEVEQGMAEEDEHGGNAEVLLLLA